MVHVLDLLGCTAQGPITEDAIAAAPEAVRDFARFLRRHREPGAPDPRAAFETPVAVHVTQGSWLGNGDPDAGFAPDFQPLARADLDRYAKRLGWMQQDLLRLLHPLAPRMFHVEPSQGRAIIRILGHIAGAQYGYLQGPLSKPAGLSALVRQVEEGPDPLAAFEECCALVAGRLAAVTDEELRAEVRHGARTWTARRAVRRLLEHQWEHLVEVRTRLEDAAT
jgi:uncharacterized damage-inducible protein DinB